MRCVLLTPPSKMEAESGREELVFTVLTSGDLHLQGEGLIKVREAEVALVVKPCLLREEELG